MALLLACCLAALTIHSTESTSLRGQQHKGNGTQWLAKKTVLDNFGNAEHGFRINRHLDTASLVELNEAGYLSVVKLESNKDMLIFMNRLVQKLGLRCRDNGAMQGMVHHFSGIKASQTFFALKQELIGIANNDNTWLVEEPLQDSMFLRISDKWSGETAPLNNQGYQQVAKLMSDKEMFFFIRRIVSDMGLFVSDEGRLRGIVPYYSGTIGVQNFAKLRFELIGKVRAPESSVSSGDSVVLSEAGYRSVAALKNDEQMAIFTRRVAEHYGCSVVDEDGLMGVVPHFSGNKHVQSFSILEKEVREACGLTTEDAFYGSMHDVVGKDGVLQIRLANSTRYKYSADVLRSAGIIPTEFAATNAKETSEADLAKACPLATHEDTNDICHKMEKKIGAQFNLGNNSGCKSKVEQAITDSHRRALMAAMDRDEEWTAVMEDDVVPLHPGYFDASFEEVWKKVPKESKIVRLSWCSFEQDLGSIRKKTYKNGGSFRLVKFMSWEDRSATPHYYTGGCTTGYLVHKSFLPEMLGIFPCCCPIDCCMERQLFYAPARGDAALATYRGEQVMINLDAWDSREDSFNYTTFNQGGVFVQDNRDLRSLRPEWNTVDANDSQITP